MHLTRNPEDHRSRVNLTVALLERASERMGIVSMPEGAEYQKAIAELKLIMARLNELVLCM
jgi:hypothetical protein